MNTPRVIAYIVVIMENVPSIANCGPKQETHPYLPIFFPLSTEFKTFF